MNYPALYRWDQGFVLASFAFAARKAEIDAASVDGSTFFADILHKSGGVGIGLFGFLSSGFRHVYTPSNLTEG